MNIHTPINTHTQIISLWASSKTEPANSRDWRSHHRRLAVDENIVYHWMHNAVKSQNICSQREVEPKTSGATGSQIFAVRFTEKRKFRPILRPCSAGYLWLGWSCCLQPASITASPSRFKSAEHPFSNSNRKKDANSSKYTTRASIQYFIHEMISI